MYRVIGAALLCASWVVLPGAWFLSALGITLLLHSIATSSRASLLPILLNGLLFGTLYVGCTLIWFWKILPLDWIEAGIFGSTLVLFLSWLFVSTALGSVFVILWALQKQVGTRSFFGSIFFASMWVLCEYIQMWIFAFLTWGEASTKAAHFSGTFIGYSLASFSPFLQMASVGGVYALSFVVVCMGALSYTIYSSSTTRKKKTLILASLLCAILGITFFDHLHPIVTSKINANDEMRTVALVSTQFTHSQIRNFDSREERHEIQKKLISNALQNSPDVDILVFPEGAANFSDKSIDVSQFLAEVFNDKKPAIIDSSVAFEGEKRLQRMYFWNPSGESLGHYDKVFLVPQGEYSPNITHFVLRLLGMTEVYERIKKVSPGFTQGQAVSVIQIENTLIGALFCSDVLSPQLYRTQTGAGAQILVNAASQALFHNSALVDRYVIIISKVRAVETARYLITAGNGVPSSVISSTGQVVSRTQPSASTVLVAHVPLKNRVTPFVSMGELVLLVPALVCLIFIDRKLRVEVIEKSASKN